MRIEELDYELPESLIAQHPLPSRDASRLMTLDMASGRTAHHLFCELGRLLAPSSMLVLNDSRVFPARVACLKSTGGHAELLLVHRLDRQGDGRERWEALVSGSGRIRPGLRLQVQTLRIQLLEQIDGPLFELLLEPQIGSVMDTLERCGTVPLPPYIRRPVQPEDRGRYQTVYARCVGSAAAPTAGLHFTRQLLDELERLGHELVWVTLHVGPGTFRPVQTDHVHEHRMHVEHVQVSRTAAGRILEARAEGRRVVAVGTTVVRTLEGVARIRDGLREHAGAVDLFIRPGHRFRVVDELITNFHLPRSTLLAMVMAMAGRETVLGAYSEAVKRRYRFFSYGDAMFLRAAGQ